MKKIKHVFFDLDRTLWDFETNSEQTLQELFAEFQLQKKLGIQPKAFIKEYKRINELFWNDYRLGRIDKSALRSGRFASALQHFGHNDHNLAEQIGEFYISHSPRKTGLVNGSIKVLDYLKPKYELHIITNGFEEVQDIKMENSGLSPYFQNVITSENVGHKKPSIHVFQFAEELTGALAENSIMIGDHFEADVTGALGAGWKAIFFEPNDSAHELHDDLLHIRSLHEIMEVL